MDNNSSPRMPSGVRPLAIGSVPVSPVQVQSFADEISAGAESQVLALNKRGGWAPAQFTVAELVTAGATGRNIPGRYYGLVVAQDGTTPGVVIDLDFGGGGRLRSVAVGTTLRGPIEDFTLRLSSLNDVVAGEVRLILLVQPDADFAELPDPSRQATLNAETYVQPQAMATDNRPTNGTEQGVLLAGAGGARFVIDAPLGETITSGTAWVWYQNPATGIWARNTRIGGIDISPSAGLRSFVSEDFQISVGYGRWFIELANGVASGAGDFDAYLQSWR